MVMSAARFIALALFLWPAAASAAGWQSVEGMSSPREGPASAVLRGRWIVGGGIASYADGGTSRPESVEIYDPTTGQWATAPPLTQGRDGLACAADPLDGLVLFAGGTPALDTPTGEADLGDGTAWSVSAMTTPRTQFAAAFAAGKFLVTGGFTPGGADSETMDPTTSLWTPAGAMPGGMRADHTMTTLADGSTVLVVGGTPSLAPTADLYDAAAGTWRKAGDMHMPHSGHCAVLLADGRVLVSGGIGISAKILASAEIYDPTSDSWSLAASMNAPRLGHVMVALPDGRVLVAGGTDDGANPDLGALDSAEVYDPRSDSWTVAPSLRERRWKATAALLADGVYVAGGSNATGVPDQMTVSVASSVERLALDAIAGVEGGANDGADAGEGLEEASTEAADAAHEAGSASAITTGSSSSGCGCGVVRESSVTQARFSWLLACMGAAAARRRCRIRIRRASDLGRQTVGDVQAGAHASPVTERALWN